MGGGGCNGRRHGAAWFCTWLLFREEERERKEKERRKKERRKRKIRKRKNMENFPNLKIFEK
jgi:hypothetical protein